MSETVANRRRWILGGALAYLGILAVVAAGLGLLYRGARERLDDQLGQRLEGIAQTAAQLVDGDAVAAWSFDPEPSLDFLWLVSRLEQIRRENDLAEVTLCDADGFVLISASGRHEKSTLNVFWDLDRPAVELAREGFASASHLYRSGDLYQKSAHAPVRDARGQVAAVLTVEGAADFFDSLATLRRGAWLTGAVVILFLALLALLLRRVGLSLERTRASLARQESLAAMGRMTAGIAHEIRNPLGIIRGAGQHLQKVLADHGLEDEIAAYIPDEVDRLDRILTGYLAFGGDAPAEPEPCDLTELARRTVRLLQGELGESGVSVVTGEMASPAGLQADPRRLQQILMNLLLNARDAMPQGGEVEVAVTRRDRMWMLTVADRGPGLESGTAERAFEPFWSSKEKGGGLGLAVSRRLAREHGGDLVLRARDRSPGAVAVLTLPAVEEET